MARGLLSYARDEYHAILIPQRSRSPRRHSGPFVKTRTFRRRGAALTLTGCARTLDATCTKLPSSQEMVRDGRGVNHGSRGRATPALAIVQRGSGATPRRPMRKRKAQTAPRSPRHPKASSPDPRGPITQQENATRSAGGTRLANCSHRTAACNGRRSVGNVSPSAGDRCRVRARPCALRRSGA
jgi:hypothetical protein